MSSESRLTVRRWRIHCLVPPGHDAPEHLRAPLDRALTHRLAPAIAAAATRAAWAGEEVVFIRTLRLEHALDANWDADRIARVSAEGLMQSIAQTLAEDDESNVVRFSNRAALLSAYVVERAAAPGRRSWFLSAFDGWAALPASAAIRSALVEEPGIGRAALAMLGALPLERVLSVLDEGDAHRIARAMSQEGRPLLNAVGEILAGLSDAVPPVRILDSPALAVWLLARHPLGAPVAAWRAAAAIARAFLEVAPELDAGGFARRMTAAAADREGLARSVAAATNDRAYSREVLRAFVRRVSGPESITPARRHTRFGGAFLLLDDLADLPVEEATHGWSDPDGASAASLVRFVVLAHALGGPSWREVFADAYWRDTFAIAPTLDAFEVSHWFAGRSRIDLVRFRRGLGARPNGCTLELESFHKSEIDSPTWSLAIARAARRVLHRVARRLPGFATSTAAYLRRNVLDMSAAIGEEPGRITVTLSRAPLNLVLSLAGLTGGERRWPWLDPRPFTLFTGE